MTTLQDWMCRRICTSADLVDGYLARIAAYMIVGDWMAGIHSVIEVNPEARAGENQAGQWLAGRATFFSGPGGESSLLRYGYALETMLAARFAPSNAFNMGEFDV
ncbi:hypothetical protein [Acidithiobacillus ferrivorans]|nr:hypothetical protein [Acidithiobacillus ferrivorans]